LLAVLVALSSRVSEMTFVRIVTLPLNILSNVFDLTRGRSSWALRTYEKRLFDSASDSLDSSNKAILARQFDHWFLMQRLHDDRMNDIYFYFPERVEKLDLPPDYRLAKLRLKNGRHRVDVSVETYEGLVRALRFSRPPKAVVSGDFTISVLARGGRNDDRMARAIDFEEHGDDPDIDR
jgi:hypothetical protein